MSIARLTLLICAAFVMSVIMPPLYAQDKTVEKKPAEDAATAQMIGTWEIINTKEPGQPYRSGYKGRPFVTKGPHAFTLVMDYRDDGSFRRISRIGAEETVQEGTWKLAGSELRHFRKGKQDPEIMYVRFDGPNQYTSTEVYENTPDPGLFAQFKRVE